MAAQIRLAHDSDVEAIAAIYRPVVETTAISFETVPPDREEMARRITETIRSYPWLVCELGGQIAGYAYATRHRVRAAYRWSVDTCRGSGLGRDRCAASHARSTPRASCGMAHGLS